MYLLTLQEFSQTLKQAQHLTFQMRGSLTAERIRETREDWSSILFNVLTGKAPFPVFPLPRRGPINSVRRWRVRNPLSSGAVFWLM